MTSKDVYAGADRVIKEMNRTNLRLFGRLKLAKFDELSLIREVNSVYQESENIAKRRYWEIAVDAYITALLLCGVDNLESTEMADDMITEAWLAGILDEADPVTKYVFTEETKRKAQRLTEALSVVQNRNAEIDKALKYWAAQIGQYAITVVDAATVTAFLDAGVNEVMWHTQEDARVCEDCDELDGKVFRAESLPPKPHWGCRCWISPVLD